MVVGFLGIGVPEGLHGFVLSECRTLSEDVVKCAHAHVVGQQCLAVAAGFTEITRGHRERLRALGPTTSAGTDRLGPSVTKLYDGTSERVAVVVIVGCALVMTVTVGGAQFGSIEYMGHF